MPEQHCRDIPDTLLIEAKADAVGSGAPVSRYLERVAEIPYNLLKAKVAKLEKKGLVERRNDVDFFITSEGWDLIGRKPPHDHYVPDNRRKGTRGENIS